MNSLTGKQIRHFRIDAELGSGGMGAVYRAHDLNLQRLVAIKVMHGYLARQPEFEQRFLVEARAVARLDHPSIVKVYDFGQRDDLLYMVMEYVGGGSLAHYINTLQSKQKVIQLEEVLYLLAQAADGLGYAHRHNVIHRDVKPANILLKRLEEADREAEPPLRAVVTDFGLAKLVDGDLRTATGTFMGTLPYMSPEQVLGKPVDGRSDIYSLGVILFQLATGRLPLQINSPTDAVQKHMYESPPPPRSVRPQLPEAVATIIEKAIAREPEKRFQTGARMAKALRAAAGELTPDDVTEFAPVHTVMSLMTELEPEQSVQVPTRMEPEEPARGEGDRLIVAHKGQAPEQYPLTGAQVTLGRDEGNDVVLAEGGVSRRHARLERVANGWQVVDLGSTNGTYLDGNKLLPDVPEALQPGQTLRLGPYYLRWQAAGTQVSAPRPGRTEIVPPGATHMQSLGGQLSVVVNPTQVQVPAGQAATLQVELFNDGGRVAHYRLVVEKLPPSWVAVPREEVQLMPGDRITLPVQIHPPRASSARAGRHTFEVVVKAGKTKVAAVAGVLVIEPFSAFAVDLQPSHLKHGDTTRISIANEGNDVATFNVGGRDPAGKVVFQSPQRKVTVKPGASERVAARVQAESRPFVGLKRTLPFEVAVAGPGEAVQTRPGQLLVSPVLPAWLIPLAGFLFVCLCAAAAFGYNRVNASNAAATRAAEGTLVAASGLTRQAEAAATTAVQSTALALTAIAQGDDDLDGLSNQRELQLGTATDDDDSDDDGLSDGEEVNQFKTDPLNPDSDGDGLSDREEVVTRQTNPNNPDSDNDGLNDGAEIEAGTDPNNRDTDGDTIPDGEDADPLALPTDVPTHTPTSTPTPSPTITPTPSPTITPSPPPSITPSPSATAPVVLSGVYTIQQRSNGRFVDAHEHSGEDFRLVTRPAQNNDTQRWIFTPLGNGLYTIQQRSNGRFVDAHETDAEDFRVVTRPAQNNDTQRWIVTPLGNDVYTIQQQKNRRFVDAHETDAEDFRLVTRPAQNNDTQRWIIRPVR